MTAESTFQALRCFADVLSTTNPGFSCNNINYAIPFGFTLFGQFLAYIFNFLIYFLWLRITEEGSVSEMRIWSVSLVKSDLKWCILLSRSLFFNINYLVSVTAGGPRSPRGHM